MRFLHRLIPLLAAVFAITGSANAQDASNPFHPIYIIDRASGTIALDGPIDIRTPLAFEEIVAEIGTPRVMLLQSGGGSVYGALPIARRIRSMGVTTVVPENEMCFSACSLIFFAGQERHAHGSLGVHQISMSGRDDLEAGQFTIADMFEQMTDFGVHPDVIGFMLRTPPEGMYVLSPEENRRYGFLGGVSPGVATPSTPSRTVQTPAAQPTPSRQCAGFTGTWNVQNVQNGDTLFVRARPDRRAAAVGELPFNARGVHLHGCPANSYCEITYGCIRGFSHGNFLGQDVEVFGSRFQGRYHVVDHPSDEMLNVRAGPSTDYRIVGELPHNARDIRVIDCHVQEGYRLRWCSVSWQGVSGWSYGRYLADTRGRKPLP